MTVQYEVAAGVRLSQSGRKYYLCGEDISSTIPQELVEGFAGEVEGYVGF